MCCILNQLKVQMYCDCSAASVQHWKHKQLVIASLIPGPNLAHNPGDSGISFFSRHWPSTQASLPVQAGGLVQRAGGDEGKAPSSVQVPSFAGGSPEDQNICVGRVWALVPSASTCTSSTCIDCICIDWHKQIIIPHGNSLPHLLRFCCYWQTSGLISVSIKAMCN